MGTYSDFSDLIRLPLGIMASMSGLAAGIIVIRLQFSNISIIDALLNQFLGQLIIGLPIPFLIVCASMAINDYYDYPSDVKNKRLDRPLVREVFPRNFALFTSITMFILGILLTIILFVFWDHVKSFILIATFFFILISVSYSTWMKAFGLLGNIGVSLSYPAALILGGMVIGITESDALITIVAFGILIFFSALGREFLKGIMDIEGDKVQGIKTVAITYGPEKTAKFTLILFTIAILFVPIPFIYAFYTKFYSSLAYLTLIGLMVIIQLYTGINLMKNPSKESSIRGRMTTKIALWVGVVGFFLSALLI